MQNNMERIRYDILPSFGQKGVGVPILFKARFVPGDEVFACKVGDPPGSDGPKGDKAVDEHEEDFGPKGGGEGPVIDGEG